MRRALKITIRPRLALAAAVAGLVLFEVLLLKPSTLDVNEGATKKTLFKDLSQMVQTQMKDDEVRYTIQGFHYTSVEGQVKQWEMNSDTALLYDSSKKVVANNARIKMFDVNGQITYIEGKEAHYLMGSKDFVLYKNVKVTFPDGFKLETEQAQYVAATQIVSSTEDFHGETLKTKTEWLQVWGHGFTAPRKDPHIHILADTHAKIHRFHPKEINDVRSDLGDIDRFKKEAIFTMDRADEKVQSNLGTLDVTSRRQEAYYDGGAHQLNSMTALQDVVIKETDPVKLKEGIKYATSQRADFVNSDDRILLTGFPSVYQDDDALTGELITIYRSKNLVEVNQANGYHVPKYESAPSPAP
jgi:LPS export ABC transporter protein LptC